MQAILTPEQMRHVDAHSGVAVQVLIERAGYAVAHAARRMMGGTYGKHVVVLAGKGNNGADGRVAAKFLRDRGAHVQIFNVDEIPNEVADCDLVIDAVYGTGFRGEFFAPLVNSPVLAVDLPSGVDACTGQVRGRALQANVTVCFAALKPGLVLQPGRALAGNIIVVDIGLDISFASEVDQRRMALVGHDDVAALLPRKSPTAHKWNTGVRAIAGSKGMMGAAQFSCEAAYRSGAGIVHLSSLGAHPDYALPSEVVYRTLPDEAWGRAALEGIERFGAAFIGPGIGNGDELVDDLRTFVAHCPISLVIDGDGIQLLGASRDGKEGVAAGVLEKRRAETVLTPHDGEFSALVGHRPSDDRIADTRAAAKELRAVVLLKGATTIVSNPDGDVWCICAGDPRLATAGSGDILTGIIAGLLAQGLTGEIAAALGAFLHASTVHGLPETGTMASDILSSLHILETAHGKQLSI